ncbi:reticulocyte binding 2, putative [Babesia ovata]|uniref:Reticulocyte binding 2, putative n=1 Tax=Babesia ovata TaxID=189622 RepID=A0A2H6KE85_9APIC|nr:reticulocyte binding 2, putative [Babesia ovata]GBE61297.1 reticulocyte binding 2, putative [Babesia ovata]
MARSAVGESLARINPAKRDHGETASSDDVASVQGVPGSNSNMRNDTVEAIRHGRDGVMLNIAKVPISEDGATKRRAKYTKHGGGRNADSSSSESFSKSAAVTHGSTSKLRRGAKLFAHAGGPFLRKLEAYHDAFLKSVSRVYNSDMSVDAALAITFVPLKEVIEALPKQKAATSAQNGDHCELFAEYVYRDALLCACYMGKARAANGPDDGLEPLAEFLYCHIMRVDYLLENHATPKGAELLDSQRVIPTSPRTVVRVWEALLSLSLAKDRKLRMAFSTVTYHIMRLACKDEIEVPHKLFTKHADTFVSLLADPNKELRYRCLQLLEHFQDERVKGEMLKYTADPAAIVRAGAVTFMDVPPTLEEALPVLRKLIARLADVSKDVRSGVYKKLGAVYSVIPVEMCTQIMCYGLAEEAPSMKRAFLHMLSSWINNCGGLIGFLSDMISQTDDLTVLENAISFYMKGTGFLSSFSIRSDKGSGGEGNGIGSDGVGGTEAEEDADNIVAYMKRFKTLSPAEMVLVNVFYQNHALPEEVKLINMIDIISYAHFVLTTFCNMPDDSDQASQSTMSAGADDDSQFVDAVESNQSAAVHKYASEDSERMKKMYWNKCLVSHALRALLVIAHCHAIEDSYQVALTETFCDKILLHSPVRSNITGLMADLVAQTTLGNNSYSHALPSRWLKGGVTFAATSLLRYVYARKFRLDGKFIGDDPQMEKRHFEVSVTRKVLSIISDIKDPFQTSGISNISIRREELERMELQKIKGFDPTSYSIEHLSLIDAKLREQMEQTWTQQAELENVKSASKEKQQQQEMLQQQEEALLVLLEKQQAFATVIRNCLKERWTRIMAIVEAFLGQTQSNCSEDAGLAEFPRAILLPQMAFFCATVVKWRDQSITDQYCDVLTSKCLGTWCMLNKGRVELWRQLNAFHVALKGALAILEGCLNQAAAESEASSDAIRRRIEMQTLRCEMYMTTLTDLLVTNVELQQGAAGEDAANVELIEELKDTLWGIVNCTVKSSKYVQSLAIRLGCRLLLTEFLRSKQERVQSPQTAEEKQCSDDITVVRLRGILEMAFVAPAAARHMIADFKFTKSTRYVPITAEDKNIIVSMCALYPTLSYRHLRNFHKVLEQVLMRSVHHALQLELRMVGFARLISFAVQTVLHRSPLYFSLETFAKYFKWLLLITIDKGPILADRGGFMSLIGALISMFVTRNVAALLDRFGLSGPGGAGDDEPRSMSDLCALANPALGLLDLRDMLLLLNYIKSQGGFVKAKANVKVVDDLIELISNQMRKLATLHAKDLVNSDGGVSVIPGEPPQIVFSTDDSTAFSDLVDAYDAYISSLGPRELCALLVEIEDEKPAVVETEPVASRRMTRSGRGARLSQFDMEEHDGDDLSDASITFADDDEDFVVK